MILNKKAQSLHHKTKKLNLPKPQDEALKLKNKQRKENQIFASNIIKEICGDAPYKLMAREFLRKGSDKKAKKFLRKRLGSMRAARKAVDKLS